MNYKNYKHILEVINYINACIDELDTFLDNQFSGIEVNYSKEYQMLQNIREDLLNQNANISKLLTNIYLRNIDE